MNITDIRIRMTQSDKRMRALVSITLDGELAIHDIKVIEGPDRLFIAMPSRKDNNGYFQDVVHPISKKARDYLESVILFEYQSHLDRMAEE